MRAYPWHWHPRHSSTVWFDMWRCKKASVAMTASISTRYILDLRHEAAHTRKEDTLTVRVELCRPLAKGDLACSRLGVCNDRNGVTKVKTPSQS